MLYIRVGEVLCPIIMHLLVMRTILLKPKGETVGEGGWGKAAGYVVGYIYT